mgnify:FL=1
MRNIKKVILVTGSGKRIGREIVLGLSKNSKNFQFILHYNNSYKEVLDLINKLKKNGINAKSIKFNFAKTDEIKEFVKKVEALFGKVDILINNASIFKEKKFHKISEKDFDEMIEINLKAPFLLSQFISVGMLKRKYGKIINITDSIGVEKTWKGYSHYCISKGGLETLTKSMSLELTPNIQVNSIAPGKILEPINKANKLYDKSYESKNGIDRILNVVFLLIQSNIISGECFKIDNGETIT